MDKKILSISDAASILGVSDETLRNWEREGKLTPFHTEGGHRRYYRADIEKLAGIYVEPIKVSSGKRVAIYCRVSSHEQKTKGDVGQHAHELFSMLKTAVSHSLSQNNMMSKTVGIMMLVNNNEPKRLTLYWKILERLLKNTFPIIFKDDNTRSHQNVTILVASK